MQRALELAQRNAQSAGGGPFGAVVVHEGRIVGEGTNRVTQANDPTAHAEIEAIRSACAALARYSLAGAQIFSSCEPCPMCLGAIHWARLDKIWFAATREDAAAIGFDDALLYRELPLPASQRRLPLEQLDRDAALSVMQEWWRNPARVPY
jgi:tRNA(Arg) A34 adenosine deaminase TadA